MKIFLYSILTCCLLLAGCVRSSLTEQRTIELPADNPKTSLDTAAQIGQKLIASGLSADIQTLS